MSGTGSTSAFSSVGSKLYLASAAPATFDAAGYAALVWKEVGEIDDIGEFGSSWNINKRTPLGNNVTQKRKGSRDFGSIALTMAFAPGDAGQSELQTADGSTAAWSCKVLMQDGTIAYTQVLVNGYKPKIGGSDDVTSASTTLEITKAVIWVYP